MNLVHPRVAAAMLPRSWSRFALGWAALVAGTCGVQPAWCADGDSNVASIVSENVAAAQRRQLASMALTPEVSTVRSRLAPSAAPLTIDGRTPSELAGVHYKVWMSRGRTDVGVGVGTLGYIVPRPDGRVEGPVALSGASPTLSVGVRYRVSSDSAVYADASGAHGLGADPAANYVNTKVGLEWKPAKHRLGFERGAIGMHFDSGYKLSLNARHGGLGLYLRGQF